MFWKKKKPLRSFQLFKACNDLIDAVIIILSTVIGELDGDQKFDQSAQLRVAKDQLQQAKDQNIQSYAEQFKEDQNG